MNTLEEINNSDIKGIEEMLQTYMFSSSKNESEISQYFEKLGIPLGGYQKSILNSEIKRFEGKVVNSLLKHIVSSSLHKNTDAGKEVSYERFAFDL